MNYSLAPMEGLTGYVYRQAHRRFYPGLSRYYTPFLSPVRDRALTTRDRNEVLPEHNAGVPLTPQLLTRSLPDLLWGARLLGEMGYDEVNLNLGCPSPTVTCSCPPVSAICTVTASRMPVSVFQPSFGWLACIT